MLRRDLVLNRSIGARYHAQHLSVAESVTALREARAEGQPATGEASPHHLLLTDNECDNWNTLAKVNPPLRSAADIAAIKEGIAEGTITVLATDHAPHPTHTKETDFASAAFGHADRPGILRFHGALVIHVVLNNNLLGVVIR